MLSVHVHVLEGKQPTPVRLRIHDGRGTHFAPLGRELLFPCGRGEAMGGHVRIDGANWYHIDGRCEVLLPAETPLIVEATKGIEYEPVKKEITLGPGQISVRLTIEKKHSLPGWFSGDSRCHFLSPHAAALEADAEGLDFVNLLATPAAMLAQDGNTYLRNETLLAFSGQVPAYRNVYVNTLNTHPVLGKLALLNTHRPVFPLSFGPPDASDDWSLFDWAQQCHRKNGLAVWVDAPHGGEALAAALLGKLDAVEITPKCRPLAWLYKMWNAGVKLPLIGGSGKDSNNTPLGAMRTYAECDGTYNGWIVAIRAGRTFVTDGPLIQWGPSTVTALGMTIGDKLELIVDGLVHTSTTSNTLNNIVIPNCVWWAARVQGKSFAHTSPVWVNHSQRPFPAAVNALDQCQSWCKELANITDEKWQTQLLSHLKDARKLAQLT